MYEISHALINVLLFIFAFWFAGHTGMFIRSIVINLILIPLRERRQQKRKRYFFKKFSEKMKEEGGQDEHGRPSEKTLQFIKDFSAKAGVKIGVQNVEIGDDGERNVISEDLFASGVPTKPTDEFKMEE